MLGVLTRSASESERRAKGTVFVVDDDRKVRAAILRLLTDVNLKGEAYPTAAAFEEQFDPEAPGCLVLDVRMPGRSGIELMRELTDAGCELPIIFLSGYGNISMAVEAIRTGAIDFIEKPFRSRTLLDRIQDALELDEKRRRERSERDDAEERFALLTPREREVVELANRGLNNKEIAHRLGVTPQAIDARRLKAMRKLKVKNLADLVRLVERRGSVADPCRTGGS